jgi:hypothetical protein
MVTKGKPTARSQSYKAILQIQDKIKSTPTTSGNDDFPSPISTPVTHDEGAQRIIDTITVLHQSLDLVVRPNPHGHALVKLLGQNFSDLVCLYQKADNRTIVLQQQLDDANTKLNAEILKIEDQLKKSQAISDFYRAQAMQAGVVPSIRRCRPISSDNEPLTQEQQSQQLSLAYTDIQVRDFALEQLQLQNTLLKSSIDQVLTSSAETLSLHVVLLEQHLQLQARLKVSSSAVQHYRNQFSEYRTASDVQLSKCTAQLQEIQAKYDKLDAQVSTEDPLLQELYAHFGYRDYPTSRLDDVGEELCKLRPHLCPHDKTDDT